MQPIYALGSLTASVFGKNATTSRFATGWNRYVFRIYLTRAKCDEVSFLQGAGLNPATFQISDQRHSSPFQCIAVHYGLQTAGRLEVPCSLSCTWPGEDIDRSLLRASVYSIRA